MQHITIEKRLHHYRGNWGILTNTLNAKTAFGCMVSGDMPDYVKFQSRTCLIPFTEPY